MNPGRHLHRGVVHMLSLPKELELTLGNQVYVEKTGPSMPLSFLQL
jgi:hypothetical protein